jgi:hypothetical protein
MKKLWNKMWEVLLKHHITVYAVLILTCIFMVLTLVKNIDHAKGEFELIKDNIVLEMELRQYNLLARDQSFLIEEQGKNLDEADQALEMQRQVIEKLIQYLKDIDEWPPSIQPGPDPNKSARSGWI